MKVTSQKLQTVTMPEQFTEFETNEATRGLAFFFKKGEFHWQNVFTPPHVGEINWIEGFETQADVFFRQIRLVGPNLFHLTLSGDEAEIRKMLALPRFFKLLREVDRFFDADFDTRKYFEVHSHKEVWDVLYSLDQKKFYMANFLKVGGRKVRVENVVILGDRLFARTPEGEVVETLVTPDLLKAEAGLADAWMVEKINKLGKVDLLAVAPNSKEFLLLCRGNSVYQYTLWGDLNYFYGLEPEITRINNIDFNHRRSLLATSNGIFEVGVQEMPNSLKATSLPRRIAHTELKDVFETAFYIEDPSILGIHPAVGIVAKTGREKVVFF